MLNDYYFLSLQVYTVTSLKGITESEAVVDFSIFVSCCSEADNRITWTCRLTRKPCAMGVHEIPFEEIKCQFEPAVPQN